MTNTTHFNLAKIEGADIVNPLSTEPANMDKIDAAMWKNSQQVVDKATATKSGNTFTIIRSGTAKPPVFTFTAGSDYQKGNLFTVDNVSVEARTPGGSDLPTNYFRTNADVMCILNGSKLTIYGGGTSILDIYPIGSVYISKSSTFDPNTAWGGTWEKIGADLTLRQAGNSHSVGTTYGEAEHVLTNDELPVITPTIHGANSDGNLTLSNTWASYINESAWSQLLPGSSPVKYYEVAVGDTVGKGVAHNNIGPSLAVNIWVRTL